MTQVERQRMRRDAWSQPKLVLLSALATAILVIPAFLGKQEESDRGKVRDKQQDTRHRIFILSGMEGKNVEEKQALENLYAWIDLKAPDKTLNPESSLGFREFAGNPPKYSFTPSNAPFQEAKRNETAIAEVKTAPMILGEGKTILTKPINKIVQWKPFWEVELPDIGRSELPEGIIWRNSDGRRIANAPKIDEKIARESWNKNAPSSVTAIECSMFMEQMPPRIILRKSCGNTELDLLAVTALRRHLLNMESITMGGIRHFKTFQTEVLWHLSN